MSLARILLRQSAVNPRLIPPRSNRRYASSSSNISNASWPLYLAVTGCVGLGGWIYLKRNPDQGEALKEKVGTKAKDLAAQNDAGNEGPGVVTMLIKDSWTPILLDKVEPYNHNTKIYTFSFGEEGKEKISGGQVASALLVRSVEGDGQVTDEKGKPVIREIYTSKQAYLANGSRPYTPISAPTEKGTLKMIIKEYGDGALTPYISKMRPGKDSLLFKGPIPKYEYKPNTFDRGLCIAGGSGITPMYQLITYSLSQPEDKTKWTLLFGNVTPDDILLKERWDELAKRHSDRLEVKYVVDKPEKGWKGESGFITAPLIGRLFQKKADEKVMAFVCGPPPQVKMIAGPKDGPRQGELLGALRELGYSSEEVYKF